MAISRVQWRGTNDFGMSFTRVKLTEAEIRSAMEKVLGSMVERIRSGTGVSGRKFSSYSVKEMRLGVKRNLGTPGGPVRLPRGGALSKSGKTRTYKAGYKELRQAHTLTTTKNFSFTGNLLEKLVILKAKNGTNFVLGWKNGELGSLATILHKKNDYDVFGFSKQESAEIVALLEQALQKNLDGEP